MTRSNGFTLIEVLVAAVMICVFAASFTLLSSAGIKQAARSRQLTKAVFAAKSAMEGLESRPFDELYSCNGASFDNGKGLITVTPAGKDLVSITVKNDAELNTLRSRY
jgi:prepilin-type N-terminal cleavage/methylation domain-containing protein